MLLKINLLEMNDMKLELWKSDFLLPSVDAKCLQFMLCARICAAPIQMQQSFAPWNSPDGTYPILRVSSRDGTTHKMITDFKTFRAFLQKEVPKCAIDGHLTGEQLSELFAYESFVEENLLPAYLYTLWIDEFNSSSITCSWYGQQVIFPYSLYFVHKQKTSARSYVSDLLGSSLSDKDIEIAVTKRALSCINLLSAKLCDKKYFFGNKPTSFDALAFGYLAPILRLPLPNDTIQAHIKGCPNLVRFIESTMNIYLPLSESDITSQLENSKVWQIRRQHAVADLKRKRFPEPPLSDEEYPLRDKIIFGIAAVVLTVFSAVHMGIINVEVANDGETINEDDD